MFYEISPSDRRHSVTKKFFKSKNNVKLISEKQTFIWTSLKYIYASQALTLFHMETDNATPLLLRLQKAESYNRGATIRMSAPGQAKTTITRRRASVLYVLFCKIKARLLFCCSYPSKEIKIPPCAFIITLCQRRLSKCCYSYLESILHWAVHCAFTMNNRGLLIVSTVHKSR